jgi:alkyl sulfatase BDS1-like metallo-beta-lactamase superfamily hydrolase
MRRYAGRFRSTTVADGSVQVEGDRGKLPQLLSLLDDFDLMFPIVTP